MTSAPKEQSRRRPPAKTIEGREAQLINAAYDLAERQLREGTASSQVTTHFLKMGTEREKLEREKVRNENLLLEARAKQIEAMGQQEALLDEALKAFRQYSGRDD